VPGTCGAPVLTIASAPATVNHVYEMNSDTGLTLNHAVFTSSDVGNCVADGVRPHYKLSWDYSDIGTAATYVGTDNTNIGTITINKTEMNKNKYIGKWVATIEAIG